MRLSCNPLTPSRACGLGVLSGLLLSTSGPPISFTSLSWLAMVPALLAIDRAPTRRSAVLSAWLTGTVMVAGSFIWLVGTLTRFAGLSLPAAFLIHLMFAAYQGSVFLVFGWLVCTLRCRRALPMALLAPLAMAASEFAVPLLFPYPLAGIQAGHPVVIQIADLLGRGGVTALLLMVNGALYDGLTRTGRTWRPVLAAALVMAASLTYGQVRVRQVSTEARHAPQLRVGVIQPNVAYNAKGLLHPELRSAQVRTLQAESTRLAQAGAQLIVWPESSYPFRLPQDFAGESTAADAPSITGGTGVPTIVGAVMASPRAHVLSNSALMFNAAGRVTGRYDKMRLLAFGEYLPPIAAVPWVQRLIPPGFGNFSPGAAIHTLPLDTGSPTAWRIGVVICYEDILQDFVGRVGQQHPHLLVNLTNDTWFGDGGEPWQHLALAVLASVEQRVTLVRAVNSGVSAFVSPTGHLLYYIPAVDPAVHSYPAMSALASVPVLSGGRTVFARSGHLFEWTCIGTLLCLYSWPRLRRSGPVHAAAGRLNPSPRLSEERQHVHRQGDGHMHGDAGPH